MIDEKKTRRKIEDFLRKSATKNQLVDIAILLGVQIVPLSNLRKMRPYQVKCAMQLRKGFKYQHINEDNGLLSEFTVLSDPFFVADEDDMKVAVSFHLSWGDYKGEISLKENNIFPENDENWIPKNWIAFSEESKKYNFCLNK